MLFNQLLIRLLKFENKTEGYYSTTDVYINKVKKMIAKTHENKGFSLIELIIVITITAIIFAVVGEVILQSLTNMSNQTLKSSLYSEAKTSVEKVIDEMRKGKEIHIYTDGATPTEITAPNIEANLIECIDASNVHWWFKISNKKLIRYTDPSNPIEIARNVVDFKIKIVSSSEDGTGTLYSIMLELDSGKTNNPVKASYEAQYTKYMIP